MNYHEELLKMWPMLFFCDTLIEKLAHAKETIAYIICHNLADPVWQPIMQKRAIELSHFYMYLETLQLRAQGLSVTKSKIL